MQPQVTSFFDEPTNTYSYVVKDPHSSHCAVIDSVLNFDYASGHTTTESADEIIRFIDEHSLTVDWILETHVHADHLSAAPYLHLKLGAKTGIGAHIKTVQQTFGQIFNAETTFSRDGSQFDQLFIDGDLIQIGHLKGKAIHTPGHTPACMTYVFGNAGFVGDTLFMPDYGTARCDFPGGDASTLYHSIQKVFALPDETRLFMCHDYKAKGRDHFANETTVADERLHNIHVGNQISEQAFVKMRTERDATLGMPKLIIPSVQINMRAGHLPPAEDNGQIYLKVPINLL
ncbi:MBL fold metallo-hydrolase [Neptunomonas phycophila]|jgi:glyoxylase-like metal-dependent hydrolase (beta-lactamase superfamily II)|uniref:MBL fold metallo-hydrolase n=1 Tax=Neptunomonas phycophila TaxID=1572645 RepID=UPI000948D44A|nr:MBL fold metallo-hydrolase [Neptunomonas phycophila]QLE97178.1 MBL fold metallo-hydrolase [Neptunomonas phycophila]